MSQTGQPLKIIWGVIDDGGIKFILDDTLSKHTIGDIVYKPVSKIGDHEYLLPLDGQTLDATKYKRLVDYLGFSTLPNINGRYLRADTTPNTMVNAGLPNITGNTGNGSWYSPTKAFFMGGETVGLAYVPDKGHSAVMFDASKSNSIYGSSDTVTPLTYTVRAYICYA